jgi:hypothetical protein
LVNEFQSKLGYRVGLYWLIFAISLFTLLFAWRLMTEGRTDLVRQFTATVYDNIPLFISLLVMLPFIAWDIIRFANRFAGPLVRIRRTMQSITDNEPVQPVRLRKDDFLMEIQDECNLMLIALEQRGAVQIENKEGTAAKPSPA